MRKCFPFIVLVLILLSWGRLCGAAQWLRQGVVSKVIDGDSLMVRKGQGLYEVRLYGIDAPEYGQRYWLEARAFSKRLLEGETVLLEPVDVDRYGRIVALVTLRGKSVNRQLVAAGYAWVYRAYCMRRNFCAVLQEEEKKAGAARRGLWQDNAPLPPWEWKKNNRKR